MLYLYNKKRQKERRNFKRKSFDEVVINIQMKS